MPDPLSELQRLGQEFDADVVTQADRDAAADIARIFLGNDDTLPDELRSGSLARHWLLDELARHRIAAIEAARPMIEAQWRPIESAPKDGRYIIAARFNEEVLRWVKHSRWITADEIADIEGGSPGEYDAGWTDGDQDDEPAYPTHWMPLPAPPSIEPQS